MYPKKKVHLAPVKNCCKKKLLNFTQKSLLKFFSKIVFHKTTKFDKYPSLQIYLNFFRTDYRYIE